MLTCDYEIIAKGVKSAKIDLDLLGISSPSEEDCLVKQIQDSIKRVHYIGVISSRLISINRTNPKSMHFDPLMAAAYHFKEGNLDESSWLVFLTILFGKDKKDGYGLLKAFYGKLGEAGIHDFITVKNNTEQVITWITENSSLLKSRGKFGNHRKYETLKPTRAGIATTIISYLEIIGDNHKSFFDSFPLEIKMNPQAFFEILYKTFKRIHRFGRLSLFDYVTMLGKIGIVNAEPKSAYIASSTGPKSGVIKLFRLTKPSKKDLEEYAIELGKYINIPYGMQIIEDALCNWQKSPSKYIKFKG